MYSCQIIIASSTASPSFHANLMGLSFTRDFFAPLAPLAKGMSDGAACALDHAPNATHFSATRAQNSLSARDITLVAEPRT
jgi:hypothetical protein